MKGFLKEVKRTIGKIGTLNIVLAVVAGFFIWFNWEVFKTYRVCGGIPESYCCAVVAATIGECGICGWIKSMKERNRDRKWEVEDQKKYGGPISRISSDQEEKTETKTPITKITKK